MISPVDWREWSWDVVSPSSSPYQAPERRVWRVTASSTAGGTIQLVPFGAVIPVPAGATLVFEPRGMIPADTVDWSGLSAIAIETIAPTSPL